MWASVTKLNGRLPSPKVDSMLQDKAGIGTPRKSKRKSAAPQRQQCLENLSALPGAGKTAADNFVHAAIVQADSDTLRYRSVRLHFTPSLLMASLCRVKKMPSSWDDNI